MALVIPLMLMSFALLMERVEVALPERDPSRSPRTDLSRHPNG
ncbi:hypothetical protein [Amycolatopsis japonica]|nr:hypothetical protein [Amycolatopsis japonica]